MPDVFYRFLPAIVPVAFFVYCFVDYIKSRKENQNSSSKLYVLAEKYYFALTLCAVIIIFLVVVIILITVKAVPASDVANANSSLNDALELIQSTEPYGGSEVYDDVCDILLDDIQNALAWLGGD